MTAPATAPAPSPGAKQKHNRMWVTGLSMVVVSVIVGLVLFVWILVETAPLIEEAGFATPGETTVVLDADRGYAVWSDAGTPAISYRDVQVTDPRGAKVPVIAPLPRETDQELGTGTITYVTRATFRSIGAGTYRVVVGGDVRSTARVAPSLDGYMERITVALIAMVGAGLVLFAGAGLFIGGLVQRSRRRRAALATEYGRLPGPGAPIGTYPGSPPGYPPAPPPGSYPPAVFGPPPGYGPSAPPPPSTPDRPGAVPPPPSDRPVVKDRPVSSGWTVAPEKPIPPLRSTAPDAPPDAPSGGTPDSPSGAPSVPGPSSDDPPDPWTRARQRDGG